MIAHSLRRSAVPVLNFFILFFYAGLVFLWFKDSIGPFKDLEISIILPLIGLLVSGGIRLFWAAKNHRLKLNLRPNKVHITMFLLILLAILIRLPFLVHADGLSHSDDAIPALMGKHISEGNLPPVYFYGQLYLGSLSAHFYGLMFTLFGYSFLLTKISALIFFLTFLILQFSLLQQIFSYRFALLTTLFYCLPIGLLVMISMDCSRADPLVLLLGFSLIYLAHRIYFQSRENLLPLFGFLAGIAFWTHQILICYMLTALVLVVLKLQVRWKKYLVLGVYFLVGVLPVLMMEFHWKFPLVKYLLSGDSGSVGGDKLKRAADLTLALVSRENFPLRYILLGFLIAGFFSLLKQAYNKGKLKPPVIYCLFPVIFYAVYLLSGFSNQHLIRYLFPLYFCLPVLFLSAFSLIRSGFKYVLMLAFILLLFFSFNFTPVRKELSSVKDLAIFRRQVTAALAATGKSHWRSGFWSAYLFSALAAEKTKLDSYTVKRYFPYHLEYYNQEPTENLLFVKDPHNRDDKLQERFCRLLRSLGIDFKLNSFKKFWLVFDIESPVYASALLAPVPEKFPAVEIVHSFFAQGFLHLTFRNSGAKSAFTPYRIHFEIPGYSAFTRDFPLKSDSISARLPFPDQEKFKLRFHLDYRGLVIPHSRQEIEYAVSPAERAQKRNRILFLSGIGPKIDRAGKQMRICEKNVSLELNLPPGKNRRIILHLYSPFEFYDLNWYGDYRQEVSIYLETGLLIKNELKDGFNVMAMDLEKPGKNILTLKFKYAIPFRSIPYWKTAALLEKIEFE